MNEFRRGWVAKAYKHLDKDGSGTIDIEDLKGVYSAKQHPDVKQGKRTEDDVLLEFLETFETHHNVLMSKASDKKVTPEEFEEYYANISASIDDDEYFALMMRNAWRLDEAAVAYGKGWKGEEEVKAATSAKQQFRSPFKRGQANVSSAENMLCSPQMMSGAKGLPPQVKKGVLIDAFRKALAQRGARGILGLARQFRIADDDGSKTLDMKEFAKVVKEMKVRMDDRDIKALFEMFDKDKSGTIIYDEFLRSVRGEMTPFRAGLVDLAFKKLDKDGSGVVDIRDMKGLYNAKSHPEVHAGRKTEDEVLGEFLETFEMHMNLGGGKRNQQVTKEEFAEYYNNVSASIDDDKYFELMIVNAWKLYGEDPIRPGWAEVIAKNRPLTASQSAPFGTTDEPTDYSTAQRPKKKATDKQVTETAKKAVAAGCPSWSKGTPSPAPARTQAPVPESHQPANYEEKQLVDLFRQCMAARGARGVLGLQRTFKVCRKAKRGG
ncbi:MAG: EF-hand domain-containing protein [Candidatus Pacebacteria bacterium]|nr:EF-hand domain-containing protein [Candidatus Paceibacterota bacterium]